MEGWYDSSASISVNLIEMLSRPQLRCEPPVADRASNALRFGSRNTGPSSACRSHPIKRVSASRHLVWLGVGLAHGASHHRPVRRARQHLHVLHGSRCCDDWNGWLLIQFSPRAFLAPPKWLCFDWMWRDSLLLTHDLLEA